MNAINKKSAPNGDWWRKLVNTLQWNKNVGLPLSEKYWQDFNDKIMSQIIEEKTSSGSFKDNKKASVEVSAEI